MNDIKLQPGTREDLRKVYLHIHASAIVDEIPEIAADLNLGRRYVNELVATLQAIKDEDGQALVHINWKAGEGGNTGVHDWYSTGYTIDSHTPEQAAEYFDRVVPEDVKLVETKAPTPRTPQNATNPAGLPMCLCGCDKPVTNRNRNYKPGHDARHAGAIGKLLGQMNPEVDEENWTTMLGLLPTQALQAKADAMGRRLAVKRIEKVEKSVKGAAKEILAVDPGKTTGIAKVEFLSGKIKIGRWEYNAEQNSKSGTVTYTNGKGEVKVATEEQAKRFYPGSITMKEA